jgi:membrane protein DedA with SNARE-associated domain
MYETALGVAIGLVAAYGLAVLLVVFVLEGALVGKLIPSRTLFVATALAVGSDAFGLASVALVAVVGATLGQLTVFSIVRRTELRFESLSTPADRDSESRLLEWFERWGLTAVVLSNVLPVARGSLTVPAAMTDATLVRFSASSVIGSSVYSVGLVAVAIGAETAIGLL